VEGHSGASRLYVSAVKERGDIDTGLRELTVKKANYGPTGQKVRLRWSDGVFVVDSGAPSRGAIAAETEAIEAYLRCLDALRVQGRNVSPNTGAAYAPTIFAGMPAANGATRKALALAQDGR